MSWWDRWVWSRVANREALTLEQLLAEEARPTASGVPGFVSTASEKMKSESRAPTCLPSQPRGSVTEYPCWSAPTGGDVSTRVPPGRPVMSTHCHARYHSYASPQPTLTPIRFESADGFVLHMAPR